MLKDFSIWSGHLGQGINLSLDAVDIRRGAVVPAPAVKYPNECTPIIADLLFLQSQFLEADFGIKSLFDANINIQPPLGNLYITRLLFAPRH